MSNSLQNSIARIEEERKRIVAPLQDLTQAQLDFQQTAKSWSIGQIAEHVGLAERNLMEIVKTLFQQPGGRKVLEVSYDQLPLTIKGIPSSMARFSFELLRPFMFMTRFIPKPLVQSLLANPIVKAKAAPESEPTHGREGREVTAFLTRVRQSTLQFLESVKEKDLSQYHWAHPLLGYQDLCGILGLIASHDSRHVLQLENVKKDPHFPA